MWWYLLESLELTGVVWDDFEKKTNKNFALKRF